MNDRYALLLSSLIMAALIVAGAIYVLGRGPTTENTPTPVPEFSAVEFSHDDLRGRVSIVHFFASWCPPCEAEHEHFMTLKAEYGATIYGINFKDSEDSRRDFLHRLGNPYLAVTADSDGTLARLWGTVGIPETFIVDKNGIIRHRHQAPITAQDIEKTLVPLLRTLQGEI